MSIRDYWQLPAAVLATLVCAGSLAACSGAAEREQRHMARGMEYYSAENYEKARVEFRNALQISPNSAEARYQNGRAAERLGNFREAAQFYQGTIDLVAEHVGARADLGRMYLFAGLPQKALDLVEPHLAKHPDTAALLTVRAGARLQLRNEAGAFEDAQRANQLDPRNENAIALLASMYRQKSEPEKAVELIRGSLTLLPKSVELHQVLAALYDAQSQHGLAEQQMQAVVKLRPADLALRYQFALFYTKARQLDAAEQQLLAGIAANPRSTEARLSYAEFLVSQRSFERGRDALQQFMARDADNLELQLGLGALLQRGGKADDAIKTYQAIVDRDPEGPNGIAARNRMAAHFLQLGRAADAGRLIAEVLKANPRDSDALLLRGNLALERRDAAGAIGDLRAVLRDQPNNPGVLRVLARAHVANGETGLAEENLRAATDAAPADAAIRIELAQLLLQTGRSGEATAMLEEQVRKLPGNAELREALVRAYLSGNDIASASKASNDLVTLRPESATGYYYQGMIAQQQGKLPAAESLFAKAHELQPGAADSLAALARVRLALGKGAQAVKDIEVAVQAAPQNAGFRNLLGEFLIARKDTNKALEQFAEATRIAPKWWLPYRNIAIVRLGAGDFPGAVGAYRTGIAATGGEATLLADLAAIYERRGDIDSAIRSYDEMLRAAPQLELARNNLAMLLVTHRADPQSRDRALDLTRGFERSANPALLDTHGWVLYKLGRYADAVSPLERAAAGAPDRAVLRYHLAMTQLKLGDKTRARENLERALSGKSNFDGIEDARAALRDLDRSG